MNPVDEFLAYEAGILKEAQAPMTPGRAALITGLATAGTLALGTVATGAAQDVLDMARNAVTRSLDFRRMVKENPEIKKLDRAKTQAYFNTLHRFSPEMAGDPVVAASWVKRMGEFDYVDPATVQQLVSTSERMRSAKSQQRIPPFQLAQAATMAGLERMKEMRTDLTPAQQAVIDAQQRANLAGIAEKARLEEAIKMREVSEEARFRRDLAQRQAEHGARMEEWRAELPRPVGEQQQWQTPFNVPGAPRPAFRP